VRISRLSDRVLTLSSHVDGENLKVDLTMAKALGGPGDKGKTNPEELFSAGYGVIHLTGARYSMRLTNTSRPVSKAR
jgi:organic hydroperoxide reductase OsmC/OhrA